MLQNVASSRSPDQLHSNMNISKQKACFSQVSLNLLKPTGHVMHQQFNIQQF